MRAHLETDTTAPDVEGTGPAYGVPSPGLLARADRGFARFLRRIEDQDDDAGGEQDAPR
jgi:hypothetical protein